MKSDWLNEVWAGRGDVDDDYKFVYMGPAGTWSVSGTSLQCVETLFFSDAGLLFTLMY